MFASSRTRSNISDERTFINIFNEMSQLHLLTLLPWQHRERSLISSDAQTSGTKPLSLCVCVCVAQTTGVQVQVAGELLPHSTEREVSLSGSHESVVRCVKLICSIILEVCV